MKKYFLTAALVVFVIVIIAALHFACLNNRCTSAPATPAVAVPTDFADCASKGFLVTDTTPRTCRAGTHVFTEVTPPSPVDTANISVFTPLANAQVTSPLKVTGEAKGNWYFEAVFPVKLLDANNKVLAQAPAQAKADWQTQAFVPFEVTLTFAQPTTPTGTLVLHNDNPSGDPARAQSVSVPVQFVTPPGTVGTGIKGTVILSPTCPVERQGQTCEKPYATVVGIFKTSNTTTPEQVISTDAQGTFLTEIQPGKYLLQAHGGSPYPRCADQTITVSENSWTTVKIICDTGIR